MPLIVRELLLLGSAALALYLSVFAVTRTSHAKALCSSEPPTKLTVEWSYAEAKLSDEKTLLARRRLLSGRASQGQVYPKRCRTGW
jgi:hypothetical protein